MNYWIIIIIIIIAKKKRFVPISNRDKKKITSDAIGTVISRKKGMCNIVEYKEYKLVYKRLILILKHWYISFMYCFLLSTIQLILTIFSLFSFQIDMLVYIS